MSPILVPAGPSQSIIPTTATSSPSTSPPGARIIGPEMAKACVAAFLAADFEGGRHTRRVEKLTNPQTATESTRETA